MAPENAIRFVTQIWDSRNYYHSQTSQSVFKAKKLHPLISSRETFSGQKEN
jgi:hypothetical protein